MASRVKCQDVVWVLLAGKTFWGERFDVFFSHLLVYHTRFLSRLLWLFYVSLCPGDPHTASNIQVWTQQKKIVSRLLSFHKDHPGWASSDCRSTWCPDEAAWCWARSWWTSSSALSKKKNVTFFHCYIDVDLTSFCSFLYTSLSADLRVTSLQNYNFMTVKFCSPWHFKWNDIDRKSVV